MKIDIRNQFIVKEIFVHDVARAVEDEDLRKLVLGMGEELGENGRFGSGAGRKRKVFIALVQRRT